MTVPSTQQLPTDRLRVALLAGSLTQGGAEKQLVYMVRALREVGADVRVYTLTRGEWYEHVLEAEQVPLVWMGRFGNPLLRVVSLIRAIRVFRPHIVQATHFFCNLYVALVGRALHTAAIGSIRNDGIHELDANPGWGPWLLRAPTVVLANSDAGRSNAERFGRRPGTVEVVPNVIDLDAFDRAAAHSERTLTTDGAALVLAVCRLVPMKRLDRFLAALALARQRGVPLRGSIVGEGPERSALDAQARALGLAPDGISFVGRRDDVPALLSSADMLAITSDHEGFPNVAIEAMAARLPVVTTPAGDAAHVVEHDVTGYVVPFGDVDEVACRFESLAASVDLRRRLGLAGRERVERLYSVDRLAERLLAVYQSVAARRADRRLLALLPA